MRKLTTAVGKVRARLQKAEAATAKWKAEAKRLEAEAAFVPPRVRPESPATRA